MTTTSSVTSSRSLIQKQGTLELLVPSSALPCHGTFEDSPGMFTITFVTVLNVWSSRLATMLPMDCCSQYSPLQFPFTPSPSTLSVRYHSPASSILSCSDSQVLQTNHLAS